MTFSPPEGESILADFYGLQLSQREPPSGCTRTPTSTADATRRRPPTRSTRLRWPTRRAPRRAPRRFGVVAVLSARPRRVGARRAGTQRDARGRQQLDRVPRHGPRVAGRHGRAVRQGDGTECSFDGVYMPPLAAQGRDTTLRLEERLAFGLGFVPRAAAAARGDDGAGGCVRVVRGQDVLRLLGILLPCRSWVSRRIRRCPQPLRRPTRSAPWTGRSSRRTTADSTTRRPLVSCFAVLRATYFTSLCATATAFRSTVRRAPRRRGSGRRRRGHGRELSLRGAGAGGHQRRGRHRARGRVRRVSAGGEPASWTYVGPGAHRAGARRRGGPTARVRGGAEALLAALTAAGGCRARTGASRARPRRCGRPDRGRRGTRVRARGGGRIEQVYDETGPPALGGEVAEAAYAPVPSEDSLNDL